MIHIVKIFSQLSMFLIFTINEENEKGIFESCSEWTIFLLFYIKSKLKTKLETLFSKETPDVFGKWKSKQVLFFVVS